MRFLNVESMVGFPPRWDCTQLPRLWQYNLHYFEWLWALGYEDARLVVLDWIGRHPPAKGAVGWEPYPVSLRLVNWCGVFWGRFRERVEADRTFLAELWISIARQAQWLAGRLETHLLGNHYLENGAALAFVGSCFKGEQPDRWFQKGYDLLREQIAEQVLPDGMHFELSPMYHSRVMYVLAMLAATGDRRLMQLVEPPLGRMLRALDAVCHPDGAIALLNDSASGVSNEPYELQSFCAALPGMAPRVPSASAGCFALPEAGYYGWRDGGGNYLLCDYGKMGPDYIPGHAHADIFSFELSLRGQRVIVDTGVHDYEASEARRHCRSTSAHNTVELDAQDQCEMWGAFRVARRGYPREVVWRPSASGFSLSGWHDGYRRLPGRPIHSRLITWDAHAGLTVTDRITASRSVKARSRLHLHPTCRVRRTGATGMEIDHPAGRVRIEVSNDCTAHVEEGQYHPQFGVVQKNQVIVFSQTGAEVDLRYLLQDIS
jgi:uncharacterized heparinase superfamily protein